MSDASGDAGLRQQYAVAIHYIRTKIDQLSKLLGSSVVHPEELDDEALISHDPIGIIAQSFGQTLDHLHDNYRELVEAHEEIRTLLNAAGAAIVVTDAKLMVEAANPKAFEGLLPGGGTGPPLCEVVVEHCDAFNRSLIQNIVNGGEIAEVRELGLGERWFHLVASPVKTPDGELARIVFVFTDITDVKQGEDTLRLFVEVFNNAAEAVLVTDGDTRIVAVNEAFTAMTGYTLEDVRGKTPKLLKSDRHGREFYNELWGSLNETGHWRGEIWDRDKSGELFPVWQSISAVRRPDGTLSNYISIWSDISSLKEAQQRLDFLAHHDALTGLPNRALFLDRLGHALNVAERRHTRLAVLFIDVDGFKEVNDTLGHLVGDRLLTEVAERIRGRVRSVDTVARLGGDEFTVLIEGVDDFAGVRVVCEKLVEAFATPCVVGELNLPVTLSVGASCYPRDGRTIETLLDSADSAMYEVKRRGKNGYRFFTQDGDDEAEKGWGLEASLREAIRKGGIEVHFQPQVCMNTRRVVAAEALARWNDTRFGSVSPARFIPVAEQGGMIAELGEAVLRSVCATLRRWLDAGVSVGRVAVNVSPLHVRAPGFASSVEAILGEFDVSPELIALEVSEQSLLEFPEATVGQLTRLRELGVQIVIDNFGVERSAIGLIGELPIDKLKIDRSLVNRVLVERRSEAMARAVVELAKGHHLEVSVNGVETEQQHAKFAAYDGVVAQGYLYGKALSETDFAQLLSR